MTKQDTFKRILPKSQKLSLTKLKEGTILEIRIIKEEKTDNGEQ